LTKIYLSGPIVHEHSRANDFYGLVVEILESQGILVFAPQFLPRVAPDAVFSRDVQELRMSDVLIAEVSHPSHGVGMEIMLAVELIKPVLLFRNKHGRKLSYMVLGATGKALFEYETMDEVREKLTSIDIESLIVQKCPECACEVVEVTETQLHCVACGKDFDLVV
jgi:nucleoside 2-deoxyribosyltransferase